MTENSLAIFENYKIRRRYDEQTETWYFSVVDIIAVLLQQPNYQTARKYWNKLKERLKKEGSESVTNCHQLKLEAIDGEKYLTYAAAPETLLGKMKGRWVAGRVPGSTIPKTAPNKKRNGKSNNGRLGTNVFNNVFKKQQNLTCLCKTNILLNKYEVDKM